MNNISAARPSAGCATLNNAQQEIQFVLFRVQELEEDPEFQRIVRTRYGQRPPLPVRLSVTHSPAGQTYPHPPNCMRLYLDSGHALHIRSAWPNWATVSTKFYSISSTL